MSWSHLNKGIILTLSCIKHKNIAWWWWQTTLVELSCTRFMCTLLHG